MKEHVKSLSHGPSTVASFPKPEDYLRRLEEEHPEQTPAYETVLSVREACASAGGRALLVGGSVRDAVLGHVSKDFDMEVYGLEPEKVEEIVAQFGEVNAVGRAFGILKISKNGVDVDVSLPRVDSKIGEGHRGFVVKTDPHMSIEDASRRRDFTMNALAADPATGQLFDPFGGVHDLERRILRVTDQERFQDDPLRVMRALQFIGRFGLSLDTDSSRLIQDMAPRLRELPRERLGDEWKKLLLKSQKPSVGLSAGMGLGIFEHMHPELPPLMHTPQEPDWHPEGDVWIHTLMVVDEAARLVRLEQLEGDEALTVMLGALAHDFGKPHVTEFIEGRLRSRGHEAAGKEPAEAFLSSIGIEGIVQQKVAKIVVSHLDPSMLFIQNVLKERKNDVADGAVRRLAARIFPATIRELALVAKTDHYGRGTFVDAENPQQLLLSDGFPAGEWIIARARHLEVEKSKPAPLLRGTDLLTCGLRPGKVFGEIIRLGDRLRDERKYTREDILLLFDGTTGPDEVKKRLMDALVDLRNEPI